MNFEHVSVMLMPTVDMLDVREGGVYVDGTLGGGGHVKAAGCLVKGTLDEVRNKLLDAVEKGMQRT